MPSLTDVAHAAGVSLTTASMVLNKGKQHNRVSAACASRVQEAARKLGYVPNYHARSMKLGRAEVLAVAMDFCPDTDTDHNTAQPPHSAQLHSDDPHSEDPHSSNDPESASPDNGHGGLAPAPLSHADPAGVVSASRLAGLGQILYGIEQYTRSQGYVITVVGSAPDTPAPQRAVLGVRQRRFDGVVVPAFLLPESHADFLTESLDVPVVAIHPAGLTLHPAVVFDERAAVASAISHLVELGHRHLAFVWRGRSHDRLFRLRADHFQAICSASGVSSQVLHLAPGATSAQVAELLRPHLRFVSDHAGLPSSSGEVTALVAGDEPTALGLLDAAASVGLRVPHDLSVVALGDCFGEATSPGLTSVSHMLADLGARAAQLCVEMVFDPSALGRLKGTRTVVAPRLRVRQSSGPVTLPSHG